MSKKMLVSAISAALALSVSNAHAVTEGEKMMQAAPIKGMEKCFGVVKAGMNDCGNVSHHCGGEAKVDGDKQEWLLMPTGLCQRIVGGSTTPKKS